MRIGEVAKRLNLPSSTIRYCEKRGLLPSPIRVSGVREFSSDALATLNFIKLGQAAGYTIKEIKSLLKSHAEGSLRDGLWPHDVESKRREIRQKISELEQANAVLGRLMNCSCASIEECVSGPVEDTI